MEIEGEETEGEEEMEDGLVKRCFRVQIISKRKIDHQKYFYLLVETVEQGL